MPAANWYPDPADPSRLRWWDATAWTEHTSAVPTHQVGPAAGAYAQVPGTQYAYGSQYAYGAQQPHAGQDAGEYLSPYSYGQSGPPVVHRDSGRAFLPAAAVAAGVAPDRCCRHGQRAVVTRRTTFQSRLPWWTYLTILPGLLVFILVATLVRKTVKAPAWPYCRTCMAQRRRDLTAMWGAIALVLPAMMGVGWVGGLLSTDLGWVGLALMVLVVVGLPVAAVVFGVRGSLERISAAQVSADGQLVSVPEAAFPDQSAVAIATAIGL
jgi:hypothetical protein